MCYKCRACGYEDARGLIPGVWCGTYFLSLMVFPRPSIMCYFTTHPIIPSGGGIPGVHRTGFEAMKFSTRHVLCLTTLVAMQLALRSYWLSMRIPAHAGLIPLSLAVAVSIYLGWTLRSSHFVGLSAGATGMLSAAAIATEVNLGSPVMSFLPVEHRSPMPNIVAVVAVSSGCAIVGGVLAHVLHILRLLVASRSFFRLSWLAASTVILLTATFWYLTLAGVSDTNAMRLRPVMHQRQVEAVLGSPNALPGLRRKGEAFWDAYTHWGRRYVSIHVVYDDNGNVVRLDHDGFWTIRSWLYW